MKFFTHLSLAPKIIYQGKSKINGAVKVIELMGRRRLVIGGLTQSGGTVEEIWEKGINKVQSFPQSGIPPRAATNSKFQRCLILGLGAGTLAKIISKQYPQAKIVGVEIDPVIVNIGRRFFGLSEIKNLKIVIADAAGWIKRIQNSHDKFDLIAVDTYLGDKFPKICRANRFFKDLSRILSPDGLIIFNVLADKIHLFEAENFLDKTSKIFNDIRKIEINKNRLILVHKPAD